MYNYILALHVTAICLVVGTLFVQSLAVVFRLRMQEDELIRGAQWIQKRIYNFIYYPILVVAVLSGLYLAMLGGWFTNGTKWLHWKLVFLMLLIGLGFLNGRQINEKRLPKPVAMFVHIGIFLVSVVMIYLAQIKPF